MGSDGRRLSVLRGEERPVARVVQPDADVVVRVVVMIEGGVRSAPRCATPRQVRCRPVQDIDDRLAQIERLLRDPPQVHVYDDAPPAPGGVWSTDVDCYEFLARHCPPGTRTLETGLGTSTVLFALWGATHTCVINSKGEADRCRAYLESRSIPHDNVEFAIGDSDEVMPRLPGTEVDLFLIDGGHGYPLPVIDWYYGASRLRRGGIVVIDDLQLPQVSDALVAFLDRDPRWVPVARTRKWAAFRRESEGSLREEWTRQPFHAATAGTPVWRRAAAAARRALRRGHTAAVPVPPVDARPARHTMAARQPSRAR